MLYERKSQSRKALFLVFLTNICYNSVMIYNIADLKVKINNKYSFTDKLCADYLSENQDSSDIEVTAGAEEIAKEKALSPNFPDGYIENICLYREICNRMPVRNRFLLHSAVVEYGGAAYAFLGRSGTGKSTHTGIWLKNLPSAKILNGDKPIIGYAGGEFTVAVIGNNEIEPLPVIQIIPQSAYYDYEAKYAPGGSQHLCPAPISDELSAKLQGMAIAAHKALGCAGVSRSDFIVDDQGEAWILETNTIPGMTETSLLPDAARAKGYSFAQLAKRLIDLAFENCCDNLEVRQAKALQEEKAESC